MVSSVSYDRFLGIPLGIATSVYDKIHKFNCKPKGIHQIIVINLMGIGDTIFISPILKNLKKEYPNAHLSLLALKKVSTELVQELVDEVIIFDMKELNTFSKRRRFIRDLRKRKFDLSVLAYPSGILSGLASKMINARIRVSHRYKIGWNRGSYFSNIAVDPKHIHAVEINFELLEALGIQNIDKKLRVFYSRREKKIADEFLEKNKINENDFVVGIHLGAAEKAFNAQWGDANFAHLGDMLSKKYKARILLFGSSQETPALKMVEQIMNIEPVLVLNKPIRETAAIMKRCNLFVSVDSGIGILASTLGIPIVSIFGPSDPAKTGPYTKNVVFVRKDLKCEPCIDSFNANYFKCKINRECMHEIHLNDVMDGIRKILE